MFDAIKRSLSAKVSIGVMAVLVFFVSVLTWVEVRDEKAQTMSVYRKNAALLASTIEKGLITSMQEGRNQDVQKTLEDVGTQPEILGVQIFNENGNIIRSSNRGELGGTVDGEVLAQYLGPNEDSSIQEYSRVFSFVKPIYNSPQCFGCHPPGRKINGILNVRISMDKAYAEIHRNSLLLVKWGVLMLLCVALSEILLLRVVVARPVGRLRAAMRKAEKGEEFDIDVVYEDELGDLAHVFKEMMGRIASMGRDALEKEKELLHHQEMLKVQGVLSSVIDGMPDGVAIIDKDMRVQLANPRYRRMFPNVQVGDHCYERIHGRDEICPHCGVTKVFQDGQVHDHESNVVLPDGSMRIVHSISAPLAMEGDNIDSAIEVIRDVTDRVSLERDLKEKGWELERANKRLAKMAVTDGLTMLFNHRFFQDSLKREFKRLARHRALPYLSLAMIDIDNFKVLNDTYGHQAGDRVLKAISKLVKDSVRLTDIVARYGGEEFVIIMPETDNEGTGVVAERIRKNIADEEFIYKEHKIKVTVSIGLSSFPQEGIKSEDDLIKAADGALYQAKAQGKNRVVISKGTA